MRTLRICASVAVLSFAANAWAAPVAITNATLHTVTNGTIANGTVVFDNGVITAVGVGITPPAGATVIDAKGGQVTPGIINSYTHVGILDIELEKTTNDTEADSPFFSAAFDVAPGVKPSSPMIAITRRGGVTRVIAAPDYAKAVFAGQGAMVSLGEGEAFSVTPKVAMFMTVSETGKRLAGGSRGAEWTFLRQAFADARFYERNKSNFDSGSARETVLPRLDLEALLPVLNGKQSLVVDARSATDIRSVLGIAAEYKLKIVLVGAQEGWMVAGEIAKAGVPVIIDPTNNLPTRFDSINTTLDNAAKLQAAGVKVVYAVLGEQLAYNARNLAQYAGIAISNGVPREAALAAITKNPADLWGIPAGALEPGKIADIVIWDGDPLEVTSAPSQVFIAGRTQSLETRQTKLRERYRNLSAPAELGYR